MQANFNNFTKAFLSGAILGGLGFSTVTVLAEQVPGYCGIVLCSSSAAASFTKQKLGLGDASLGWWDCRIQGKCQDVQKDIQKLKMTAQDCTYDKLVSFKEDISALDTKLGELVAKFGTKGREAVGYDMRDGLTDDLLSHYKQCYAEGLFKPDRNSCITANCSKKVAEIEKLEVSSDNCKIQLRTLYPHASQTWDFGYEKELVTSKVNEFKEKCIDASLIPAATMYGMPIYKNNLALAEQSKALQDKLDSEVNAFQEDEASCSSENFSNLDKEVVALGDSLEKLGDATEAKETTWCTQITKELSQKIHQHFVQCETKGLFPTDKTKCLTEECKTKIAAIEGYPVSEPSCQQNSRQNFFLMPFRYEESLVKTALTTYETKCIEANFLPAESYQGIGVLKKDLGLAEQCASIQDKLISELNSAKVDTDGCSTGLYSKLKDQLKNYDNLLEKLAATSPSARNFKIWRSEIIDGFDNKIESHFVNCEAKGLFPANKSACLSQKCKALEREIQSFPVNAKSCKEDRQQLANETTYKFEIPLVKGFLAKFDQRCIDENIIPAGTVYDHQFLKKDLANAEKTKKIGDQLTEELSNIKENTAGCTTEQFNKLDKELTAYQEGLKEMLVALGEPLDAYWAERLFNTQNNKLVSHFRSCENSHLFPANKDACLSPRCKSRQQQIEALKVNKEDCTHKINDVIASSTYSFEGPLLAGMINEFKTKCKDEDFLPYKRYKGEPLVKSDYLAHENEMRKKIDAMGHNGEKVPNYSKITLLPWKDVVAKVNSLQVNKNDCSFDKSIMPLIIQMDAYEHEWRSAGFELPGDFEELVNKRNQFRKECNEKKPTT